MEESKKCSWFSKGQKLETVRVLWSAYHTIYNHSDDLASREKISIDKSIKGSLRQSLSFGVDAAEDFKENMLRDYNCWCELKLLNDVDDTKLRLLEQSAAIDKPTMGLIYLNIKNEKRVMNFIDILKFCDDTLERILKEVKMNIFENEFLKKASLLGKLHFDRMKVYVRDIPKILRHLEQMRRRESFVNGRLMLSKMRH
nr:hypothetical protein [Tanacetum cinerariifolium]